MGNKQRIFRKLLVANRGEIAVRVMNTARHLGYRTVAVYSEADANAPHVHLADEAVCIGPAPVGESYLRSDAIIDAAQRTGADAIHPGYGFLSENAEFARACEENGITFIGPPREAIALMGSKRQSKIAMQAAGVPTVPGYEGEDQSDARLIDEAANIGFPVMVKASAGGGGRGMRLVTDPEALPEELRRARSEAKSAFGSDELILEKAVQKPRHIEIQVFADHHGNCVYLGERDCSVQRRHQKVVEEAPSPFVTPALRKAMGEAAVEAARSCGYVGAGTVEFLVDNARNFYFLEMNTRLQVEHPVTECVTGQDLVAWQLRVAAGEALPLTQSEIQLRGHAIEVRLYAEDPAQNFTPQTGILHRWKPAHGPGLRYDSGIASGSVISPFYDPMLAKVIAFGEDREEARRRLILALEDTVLFGVTSNRHFLVSILDHPRFIAEEATTALIGDHLTESPAMQPAVPDDLTVALATLALFLANDSASPDGGTEGRPTGWSNSQTTSVPCHLTRAEQHFLPRLQHRDKHFEIHLDEATVTIDLVDHQPGLLTFSCQGVRQQCQYLLRDNHLYLQHRGGAWEFRDLTHQPASSAESGGSGVVRASMDGAVIDVGPAQGDRVHRGQILVVLEAMKMEHPLKADVDGTVSAVHVKVGQQVKLRQILVEVTPDDATAAAGRETQS